MDAVVDRRCNDTNEVDDAVVIVVSEGYLESFHGVASKSDATPKERECCKG